MFLVGLGFAGWCDFGRFWCGFPGGRVLVWGDGLGCFGELGLRVWVLMGLDARFVAGFRCFSGWLCVPGCCAS